MSDPLVKTWRKVVGDERSWVMFSYGTCVIVSDPQGDLSAQAIEILKEWGPSHAGPKGGYVEVKQLMDSAAPAGWIVIGENPDVLAYVYPDEGSGLSMQIGLTGRTKRDRDSKELQVVHVEDNGGGAV